MGKTGFDFAFKKLNEKQANNTPRQKYDYVTMPKDGSALRLRFLTLDGPDSCVAYQEHFLEFKNTWKRSVSCPDFENDGEKVCILCKARSGPGTDLITNRSNLQFLMNVIERHPEGDTRKLFKVSAILMGALRGFAEDNGGLGDRDYMIALIDNDDPNVRGKKVYQVAPVSKKPVPLSEADTTLADTRYDLAEAEPKYDEQELLRLMAREAPNGSVTTSTKASAMNVAEAIAASVKKSPTVEVATKETKSESKEETAEEAEEETVPQEFFKSLRKYKPN